MTIRILLVDDSLYARHTIMNVLDSSKALSVVASVSRASQALDKIRQTGPDVVLMKVAPHDPQPVKEIRRIMKDWPVPLLLLATQADDNSQKHIFDAMDAGAIDFLMQPPANQLNSIKDELIRKIQQVALARLPETRTVTHRTKPLSGDFSNSKEKIIVIGSSTGGPRTLERLLGEIPANIPAPILVVQHMPKGFTKSFSERLNKLCSLEVREAKDGEPVKKGVALIAPSGQHMLLEEDYLDTAKVRLTDDPPELGVRPTVNKLFKSAALVYGSKVIGIVLTGMGFDGTLGAKAIKERHGTIIAQSKESCVIYGMPKSIVDNGFADEIVSLDQMTVALIQLLEL
ncbi:MAG: chemotaxis-specific protein-glutamate methyltransferase CheB [Nanobdellota archaeon]